MRIAKVLAPIGALVLVVTIVSLAGGAAEQDAPEMPLSELPIMELGECETAVNPCEYLPRPLGSTCECVGTSTGNCCTGCETGQPGLVYSLDCQVCNPPCPPGVFCDAKPGCTDWDDLPMCVSGTSCLPV